MWVAKDLDGTVRVFEFPPSRFHEGPMLDSKYVGFNDAIRVGDNKDIYSFWAIRKNYDSNEIEDYGYRLYQTKIKDKCWESYEPDCVTGLSWNDEPVEIEIIRKNEDISNLAERKF